MNQTASTPTTHSKKIWIRIAFVLSYNIINALSLMICAHFTSIVRADGPVGFDEFFIKIFIYLISMAAFWVGLVLSLVQHFVAKLRSTCLFLCVLAALLLAFFAALGVIESCGDNAGYCRHWRIVVVTPD
jgi:hypothetical protein